MTIASSHVYGPCRFFPIKGRGIINERDEVIYDYQGRAIRLPRERWLHIVDPVGQHSYMAAMQSELLDTLRFPDIIRRSRSEPDRVMLYYKWFDDIAVGNKWLCVVVEFLVEDDAFVRTAYVTYRLKRGEELWRKGIQ